MSYFNFKLRPYQEAAPDQVRLAMLSGARKVLAIAPTGSGKSVIFTYFSILASLKGSTVTILTHRKELLENADSLTQNRKGINVCMVETFHNRIKSGKMEWPSLLIIDEAHIGNFKKIIEACPESTKIFGLTATPVMAAKTDRLANYYDKMVELTTIEECLKNQWLCPYRHLLPKYAINGDNLVVENGEYSDASLIAALGVQNVEQDIKTRVAAMTGKVIVFGVNIKHTERLAALLDADFCVHSKTPDRDEQVAKYKAAKGRVVMVNCGILTTGFDDPTITDVVLVRRTKSLALYLQMIGRGSRLAPGKKEFRVWDFGRNHDEHGLWSAPRDWHYYFAHNQANPKQMVAPTKKCVSCESIIYASARKCNFCGVEQPLKKKAEQDVTVEGIEEVAPVDDVELALRAIADQQIQLKKSVAWAYHQVRLLATKLALPLPTVAKIFARLRGYADGWFSWHHKQFLDKKKNFR